MEVFDVLLWIVVLTFTFWAFSRIKEHFSISLPSFLGGREVVGGSMHDVRLAGYEIASLTPFTCPPERPDLTDGLCYEKCRDGYHGVGPVCWVDSYNRGIGTPVGLEPCPSGWSNDGLTCREPLGWNNHCVNWGLWWTGCATGGAVRGRLNGGGVCPNTDPGGPSENTEKVDGLCYKKCPADKPNHIPGMPYLCYKGGDLSYGRGVGKIPSLFRVLGKYPIL